MRLRIKELREDGDIMQKELATYLSVKQNTYSQYENGNRQLPLSDQIGRVLQHLNGLSLGNNRWEKALPEKIKENGLSQTRYAIDRYRSRKAHTFLIPNS